MLKLGILFANSTASVKAPPFAIMVEEVTIPFECVSAIARFTPEVNPKSSAFTMSRRKQSV